MPSNTVTAPADTESGIRVVEQPKLPVTVTAYNCGLDLANASESDMKQIFCYLEHAEGTLNWFWGDFLVEDEERYADAEGKRIYGRYEHQAKEIGKNVGKLAEYKYVAKRWPLLLRSNNVSWTHYREATVFWGKETPIEQIAEWLQKAEENEWSVKQMRIEMRKAAADPNTTNQIQEPHWWRHVQAFRAHLSDMPIDDMDDNQAKHALVLVEPILEWGDRLRERVKS